MKRKLKKGESVPEKLEDTISPHSPTSSKNFPVKASSLKKEPTLIAENPSSPVDETEAALHRFEMYVRQGNDPLLKKRWTSPPAEKVFDLGDPSVQEYVKTDVDKIYESWVCSPLPAKKPTIEDVEKVFKTFEENRTDLSGSTNHKLNEDDVCDLLEITRYCIQTLNKAIEDHPSLIIEEAKYKTLWPVMISANKKVLAKNQLFFEKIKLATGIEGLTALFNPMLIDKPPAKKWAAMLLQVIQSVRHVYELERQSGSHSNYGVFQVLVAVSLKETEFKNLKYTNELVDKCLSLEPFADEPSIVQAWWEVAKNILMLNTNGHPEAIDELYQIGRYNAEHASALKTVELNRLEDIDGDYNKRSSDANVRAAIFKRLKKEFVSLAKKLPDRPTPRQAASEE